ncbi:MAG: hypothetical protein V3U63_02670 [Gemmatimonadota bacterium]
MLSARGWARLMAGAMSLAVLGIVGCEEEDAAFGPFVDDVPPTVSIVDVQEVESFTDITVRAEDFIAVTVVITEIRDPNRLVAEITPAGDTLVLGFLLGVDTTRFSGRNTDVTVISKFQTFFTQPTIITIRAKAIDAQLNEAVTEATIILAGGGTTGGGLGFPVVSIFSPLSGQTVRDNTLIRVGVLASDATGLAQLNVLLTGVVTQPQADTIRFAVFRTDVDTLLDFFIPSGNLGTLTITAEAINLNSISAFASISVTVAQVVTGDTIPPVVSMVVSGGVQRRLAEAARMEADDSLIVDVVASDNESAVTRIGVTFVIKNATIGGDVFDTIFQDSILSPAISGTVPVRFVLVPDSLPLALFDSNVLPDTLFFEITAWAFDAPATPNCGATIDIFGGPNSLQCTSGDPILALGLPGGFTDRLIVAGRTVAFPQGSVIADAAVDTIRELLLLSDLQFGAIRPFDLRAEQFIDIVPVGSEPWGIFLDNSEDGLLAGNSGGTNISLVDLGPRTNPAAIVGEVDRFQTQDLQIFQVFEAVDVNIRVFISNAFDFSDRPQFVAEAANGLILFSTKPAVQDGPGTIREYDPAIRELRFFTAYAERRFTGRREIQIVNADSVFPVNGGAVLKVCDHERGNKPNVSCIFADFSDFLVFGVNDAATLVAGKVASDGWDTEIHSDLFIPSVGLQDTTFVTASGDREFVAFGEGDTPGQPGRIIMYESATQTITNSLMVSDLTGNAAQQVFGLALDNDGRLGVGRGQVAFFFGPDTPGGPNVLRLLGINNDIQSTGTGAALHPDHDQFSLGNPDERLAFLGSGDARLEIIDTRFFSFKRGDILIRDPIVGPLKITRRLAGLDPANVVVRLYGITANGVVVIPVRDVDIDPIP